MRILVTGGSTQVMIDKVRCISNIFKGKTAVDIAEECGKSGYKHKGIKDNYVKLLTSNQNNSSTPSFYYVDDKQYFKTYDELYTLMEKEVTTGNYDCIINSAAISDYRVEGTYVSAAIPGKDAEGLVMIDSSTKISSSESELYLKLVPTEKIIDKIRDPWGFKGKLVKFKLQVGISDFKLIEIAQKSREHSKADIIVANCLEWAKERAFIITADNVEEVKRYDLGSRLIKVIESL